MCSLRLSACAWHIEIDGVPRDVRLAAVCRCSAPESDIWRYSVLLYSVDWRVSTILLQGTLAKGDAPRLLRFRFLISAEGGSGHQGSELANDPATTSISAWNAHGPCGIGAGRKSPGAFEALSMATERETRHSRCCFGFDWPVRRLATGSLLDSADVRRTCGLPSRLGCGHRTVWCPDVIVQAVKQTPGQNWQGRVRIGRPYAATGTELAE